jgi:hypothetical protein
MNPPRACTTCDRAARYAAFLGQPVPPVAVSTDSKYHNIPFFVKQIREDVEALSIACYCIHSWKFGCHFLQLIVINVQLYRGIHLLVQD